MAEGSGSRLSPLLLGSSALPFLLALLEFRLGDCQNCAHHRVKLFKLGVAFGRHVFSSPIL